MVSAAAEGARIEVEVKLMWHLALLVPAFLLWALAYANALMHRPFGSIDILLLLQAVLFFGTFVYVTGAVVHGSIEELRRITASQPETEPDRS